MNRVNPALNSVHENANVHVSVKGVPSVNVGSPLLL
jgi:hypothetical protein